MSILSGYLGPTYKAPDVEKPGNELQTSIDDIRRNDRHDFRVFSEAEYFKNLNRNRPKYHNHRSNQKAGHLKGSPTTSLEDMLFTDTNVPNLLGETPNRQTMEQPLSQSNATLLS
jgi:hypothetical protein